MANPPFSLRAVNLPGPAAPAKFARRALLCAAAFVLAALPAQAGVKLPAIFGDHMVLQQETTLPVWGWADPGEKITITFGGEKAGATASASGKWRAELAALPAGTPSGTLIVAGKDTVTIHDVLVGDVWLCSGQSNMEFPLSNAFNRAEAVPQATDSQIRLYRFPHTIALAPREDAPGKWEICDPQTVRDSSAVAYFFAKNLRPVLKRPIGLVESCVGGTPAEAWTDLATLQGDPVLRHYAGFIEKTIARFPGGDAEYENRSRAYDLARAQMLEASKKDPAFQATVSQWQAAAAKAQADHKPVPPAPRPPEPRSLGVQKTAPTVLFNGMIAPLIPFALKGVIWYQGEANGNLPTAKEYATLFPAMITGWRSLWKQGDFPFLFVQLANFNPPGNGWPYLRESQLKTLRVPKTGMAVTIDIGTGANIHPPDKADVGLRLSLAARHIAYGENLVSTGPLFAAMRSEGSKLRLSFQPGSVGSGLRIGAAPWVDPKAAPISTTELAGFEIAGADRKWVPAHAEIQGDAVIVSSPDVTEPVAGRYAWANDPHGNLYNREKLPASPFRTDQWDETATAPARSATPAAP